MREILTINVGQAGVQIGSACWEQLALEHNLYPNGDYIGGELSRTSSDADHLSTFFELTAEGRYVARSIFVDLETSAIDEVRMNEYRDLFAAERLLSGNEGAANNFARGYHTSGRELGSRRGLFDRIRRIVESSAGLAGFLILHSHGGGTGSGLTSLIMHHLDENYSKLPKIQFVVYPSPKLQTAVTEPYNAVLNTHHCMEAQCAFLMDNEATYEICSRDLLLEKPTYAHVNRLSATVISSITVPLRFGGTVNVDLADFQTNLVPYPRIHYPLIAYSPLLTRNKMDHQRNTIEEITLDCFRPFNQLVKCDPRHGKYMACCLLYRGSVEPKQISEAINKLKEREQIKFVNWCPTGFKMGINNQPPVEVPKSGISGVQRSLCMLANTTAIAEAWARIDYQFDLMYAKRAYVHWYLAEGMEEQEFIEARENLSDLEAEYSECGMDTIDEGTIVEESTQGKRKPTPI